MALLGADKTGLYLAAPSPGLRAMFTTKQNYRGVSQVGGNSYKDLDPVFLIQCALWEWPSVW